MALADILTLADMPELRNTSTEKLAIAAALALEEASAILGYRPEMPFSDGVMFALRRRSLYYATVGAQASSSASERVTFEDGRTIARLLPGALTTGVAEIDAIYKRNRVVGLGV
jgi:hypothetical protein